jgi:hypothetical protein
MRNVLLPTLACGQLLNSAATVFANPSTYICIEQRSLGWEPRDGGSEEVGVFKPDEERFFIKYYPLEAPSDDPAKITQLPKIDVVRNSSSNEYPSADCEDLVYTLPGFAADMPTMCLNAFRKSLMLRFGTSMPMGSSGTTLWDHSVPR